MNACRRTISPSDGSRKEPAIPVRRARAFPRVRLSGASNDTLFLGFYFDAGVMYALRIQQLERTALVVLGAAHAQSGLGSVGGAIVDQTGGNLAGATISPGRNVHRRHPHRNEQ